MFPLPHLPAWMVPIAAFLLTQMAIFATSIYLHRALAHGALKVHPALDLFFRTILWITTGQRRREWVAVHRKHHTFTDRTGDPHSPLIYGFWRVQLGNVYYYAREARNPETIAKFAPELVEDRWDRLLFSWGYAGALFGVGLAVLAFGLWGGLALVVAHLGLYVFVAAPLINGLGHWRGQQNFPGTTTYNWRVLSLVTGGEALHNNHHNSPASAKFSVTRSEFDPSWLVIRVLAAVGLVTIPKYANYRWLNQKRV